MIPGGSHPSMSVLQVTVFMLCCVVNNAAIPPVLVGGAAHQLSGCGRGSGCDCSVDALPHSVVKTVSIVFEVTKHTISYLYYVQYIIRLLF